MTKHCLGFSTQEGNGGNRAVIGVRGEQPNNPELPLRLPVLREELEADIVHVHPPVNARLDVGLGDDDRRRFGEESPDLWRDREEFNWRSPSPTVDGKQNSFVRGFNTIMQEGADCFVKIPDTVCRTMRFIQLRRSLKSLLP